MSYTLLKDGDGFEQHYWNEFLKTDFPEYEKYWSGKITPLTNRPKDIHFKSSQELNKEGFSAEDVCKAQLHYTAFRHLVRSYEILKQLKQKNPQSLLDTDLLSEGLFHVAAAQDVAFEFLQRVTTPFLFDPWAPKRKASSVNQAASQEAQNKWKSDNGYPLQTIRDYRNHLAHGRMSPSIQATPKVLLPKIGLENSYLDWRLVTDWNITKARQAQKDFDTLDNILDDAWSETIKYCNDEWKKINNCA